MEHTAEAQTHAHPPSRTKLYVICFITLAVLTLLELTAGSLRVFKAPVLIVFAIVKALLVVMFYMHLRFDSKWFTYMVGMGAICGIFLFFMFGILFGIDLNMPATPVGALPHGK